MDSDWLTLEEIEKLENHGIEFVENTGVEILALAKEMNMRLDGTWKPALEDAELQNRPLKPSEVFLTKTGNHFPTADLMDTCRGVSTLYLLNYLVTGRAPSQCFSLVKFHLKC